MRRQPRSIPILLLALAWGTAAVPPAAAEERVLTLDPQSTSVGFTLGATLHTVSGSFRLERGEVRFDPETGAASGEVVVDATSGDTGNRGRDETMHADVLESGRHPRFVLTPVGLRGELGPDGSGEVTLIGDLEVHGTSHRVEMTVRVTAEDDRLRASATLTVPFVEWGMEDPSTFLLRVDKRVEVSIEAVGDLAP